MRRITRIVPALLLSGVGLLWASPGVAQDAPAPSVYDRIWRRVATWYQDDTNPIVQSVLFTGRFQQDYATVNADEESHSEWNVRRMRLGGRVGLLREITVHVEADLNPQESDPLYLRLTDAYVAWSRGPGLVLTLGKQGVPFTLDGSTSSKELLTIDRNNLSNNLWFPQEYIPGLAASGARAPWTYRAGAFSGGRANKELGEFSGSVFGLIGVSYSVAALSEVGSAVVSASYMHQDPDPDNTFTRPLSDVGSANFRLEAARWGVRSDVSVASGSGGQSDLWGVVAMPYVNLTPKLQLVTRYTLVKSADENGVGLATYESRIGSGRGDRYQEGYLGANYYFYTHKLKLQTGLQIVDMSDEAGDGGDFSGWSWTTGLRVSW